MARTYLNARIWICPPHFVQVKQGVVCILPIGSCSRRIVASLHQRGYEVTFREFDGDHEITDDVARQGMDWLARK